MCFAFSMTLCGFFFLLTSYISLINGKKTISKLSLWSYIFGMHFCFYQCVELLILEKFHNHWDVLLEAGFEMVGPTKKTPALVYLYRIKYVC